MFTLLKHSVWETGFVSLDFSFFLTAVLIKSSVSWDVTTVLSDRGLPTLNRNLCLHLQDGRLGHANNQQEADSLAYASTIRNAARTFFGNVDELLPDPEGSSALNGFVSVIRASDRDQPN